MAVRLSASLANSLANAITTAVGNAGKIEIRTGSQPATADTTASGSVLATFTLGSPGFGSSSGGVITLSGTPLTVAATGTGTAGWFRLMTSANASILDGSIGTSANQINLNTTSITTGVNVTITSGTITMPTS